jgi:hypothetical protein
MNAWMDFDSPLLEKPASASLSSKEVSFRKHWAHLDTATVRKRMGVVALAIPSQLSAS